MICASRQFAAGIASIVATAFTRGEPTKVHHLDRDPEFLIELPAAIESHRILIDRQGLR